MIPVQHNVSLKPYNTFGLEARAKHFVEITEQQQLIKLAKQEVWEQPKFILGGGSNVLIKSDFDGLVIRMNNRGIRRTANTNGHVKIKVQAGENWHQFVLYTIREGLGGVENLSLIPGSVGASPMQNIGAYGVEIEEVFVELTAFHMQKKEFQTFSHADCEFGYRSSIFKTSQKGNYIITDVTFELSKKPEVNTSYGAIQQTLSQKGINNPTIQDISDAVIEIRQSKLPEPEKIGNSGSFFKNPVVNRDLFQSVYKQYPEMPYYKIGNKQVKIPAGWLIEQCGFKGKKTGNTGTYKNQALILVNHGEATGEEIWSFAQEIQQAVKNKFGIKLEPEVNLIGE